MERILADQISTIIDIIENSEKPLGREDILALFPGPDKISSRTLIRRLNDLVSAGQIVAEGQARSRVYRSVSKQFQSRRQSASASLSLPGGVPVAEDGRDVLAYVTQPLAARQPVAYDRSFLDTYVPNQTWYLVCSK
jgi:hypothetical protein